MNFFGHAVVANEICSDPEFVLGAMLPDFEGMVGISANRFTTARVAEGVEAHHVTDHVFHGSSPFLRHQSDARQTLQAANLRTGPRRGVAHVGVELVLDAALGAIAQRTNCYKTALLTGLQTNAFAGAPLLARAKLTSLVTALVARSAYVVPKTPTDVVHRLERIFAHRRALCLRPDELPIVAAWVQGAWAPILRDAEVWLAGLVESASNRLNTRGLTSSALVSQIDSSLRPTPAESELL